MLWRRGKRLNDWSMRYVSDCGRYRVDRVNTMGRTKLWRAMILRGDRWEFLTRKYYRTREAAEQVCARHAASPEVSQMRLELCGA
jgi:hypothetical protein